MRLTLKEFLNIIIAGCAVSLVVGYASWEPSPKSWEDGYMHGYYHGTSDGAKGEPAPDWLEDLRDE